MIAVAIAAGVTLLALVAALIVAMARRLRRRLAEERAALEHEGIVLDGGVVGGVFRFRNFKTHGMYARRAIAGTRRLVVLTERQLVILGGVPAVRVPRGELSRFSVGIEQSQLRLVTDDPPGATGHLDIRLAVADPARWVSALREAGCAPIVSAA